MQQYALTSNYQSSATVIDRIKPSPKVRRAAQGNSPVYFCDYYSADGLSRLRNSEEKNKFAAQRSTVGTMEQPSEWIFPPML